jgi:ubiquitin-like 1-activating enzyme E1 B
LAHGGRRDRLFYAEKLALPNPACYVCRNVYVTVPTDPERATLGDLINDILAPTIEQGGLGLGSDVSIMESGR